MKLEQKSSSPVAIRAVAVGKIKEKLENLGLAMLSLALMHSNPMSTWGEFTVVGSCLLNGLLAIYLSFLCKHYSAYDILLQCLVLRM